MIEKREGHIIEKEENDGRRLRKKYGLKESFRKTRPCTSIAKLWETTTDRRTD